MSMQNVQWTWYNTETEQCCRWLWWTRVDYFWPSCLSETITTLCQEKKLTNKQNNKTGALRFPLHWLYYTRQVRWVIDFKKQGIYILQVLSTGSTYSLHQSILKNILCTRCSKPDRHLQATGLCMDSIGYYKTSSGIPPYPLLYNKDLWR